MKRKLGIKSECLKDMPSTDSLKLIKNAGFDCYFTIKTSLDEVSPLLET